MSSRVTPASSAAWIVASDSPRSASPYSADMPIQPSPRGKTAGPVEPSRRRGPPEAAAAVAAAVVVVVAEVLWFVVMQTRMA
ncbi:hypothetical protein GCM10009731_35660 [Streptomyces globosus]